MPPKCKFCNLCLDLIYFGNKRFYHCFLCGTWYDGILPNLYVVAEEEVNRYAEPIFGKENTQQKDITTDADLS